MIPIKQFLNKIKWDKRLNPADYNVAYYDRVTGKENEIAYTDIRAIEGSFMIIGGANIPLHRIRRVLKKGKVVWSRL